MASSSGEPASKSPSQGQGEGSADVAPPVSPPETPWPSIFIDSPRILIELALDPPIFAFGPPDAPTMVWKITLMPGDSAAPMQREMPAVTLYTENSPLDPIEALRNSGFKMRDLSTGLDVKTFRMTNRQPILRRALRVRGSPEEPYLVTLEPGVPVTFTKPFGRGRRPQPWSVVRLGKRVDDQGRPIDGTRESTTVWGVDGLEPGHEYEIGLNMDGLRRICWAPVIKEHILLESRDGPQSPLLWDYPWIRVQALDFEVSAARLKVLEDGEETE